MARRVSLSVTVSAIGHLYGDDLAALTDLARMADASGIDQLVMPDHVVMGPHLENYPYGRFPLPLEEPWPEPLTVLAAMAGASTRVVDVAETSIDAADCLVDVAVMAPGRQRTCGQPDRVAESTGLHRFETA